MSTLKVNTILNASGGNDVTNLGSWKKLSTTTISSNVDNVTLPILLQMLSILIICTQWSLIK